MKIVRDYLTSTEINYITEAMIEKTNAYEREMVKDGLIIQLVCEDVDKFESCEEYYDEYIKDPSLNLKEIIRNYDILDKIVAEETGVKKIIEEFTNNLNAKLDDATKNMDLNGAISQLKEISEKGDVVDGNVKEIQKPRRTKSVSNK